MRRYFFYLIVLLVPLSVLASEKRESTVSLSKLKGQQWAQCCVNLYPEILWLASSEVKKTEEGRASAKESFSEMLFGSKFIEFDRTLMTLRSLKLILEGSKAAYLEFTACQPEEMKLTKNSFNVLHQQGQKLLTSHWKGMSELEMIQALEAALILGDMGKSQKARNLFAPYDVNDPDHDDFYGSAMNVLAKHPDIAPSFSKLSPRGKQLLCKVANLAHYGHITHLEGGLNMFNHLEKSRIPVEDPTALAFDYFVHICDVAGAFGHISQKGSLAYTELTFKALQATYESVCILCNPQKTAKDAYVFYLNKRAGWLNLNANNKGDCVLARVGAMLRLFTPEEGTILKRAIAQLSPEELEKIISQFDVQDKVSQGRTPTYMPAVLLNLMNNDSLGSSKEERLMKAVTIGLPFLSKVLEKHTQLICEGKANASIPLNFCLVAKFAKEMPLHLIEGSFDVDVEGNVIFKS